MISLLQGKIISVVANKILLLTSGGVGYELLVNINSAKAWQVGQEASILTYLVVRENALELYGFANAQEKQLFEKFLLVGGIGPKTALHLLSVGTVQEISTAISRGDLTYLTKVSGIGKKTAERILVELKSKMATDATGLGEFDGALADVIEGLAALGYSIAEARDAVKDLDVAGKSSEQLLKEALQRIR